MKLIVEYSYDEGSHLESFYESKPGLTEPEALIMAAGCILQSACHTSKENFTLSVRIEQEK